MVHHRIIVGPSQISLSLDFYGILNSLEFVTVVGRVLLRFSLRRFVNDDIPSYRSPEEIDFA